MSTSRTPTETWTLLAIDWDVREGSDLEIGEDLFEWRDSGTTICQSPVPKVTLFAYRSAAAAADDALRVSDRVGARSAMLTCELTSPEYVGFGRIGKRLFELLRIVPAGVALCALSTHEAVRHASAEHVQFTDMGSVGLGEVGGRERVFQITLEGVHGEDVILDRGERVIDTLPGNFGYFVGRKPEFESCCFHLERGRSVTLTGLAGIGKSHLADRVARELKSNYNSGVAWVSLALAETRAEVLDAFAVGLGLAKGEELFASVRTIVLEEQVLLILDGVELCREPVRELLDGPFAGIGGRLILTASTPVGFEGEVAVPVAPMAIPPSDGSIEFAEDLYDFESSALFLDRISELNEKLLTHMDTTQVAELMQGLEGHPQRICLAAAQIRFKSIYAILSDLAQVKPKRAANRAFAQSLAGLPETANHAAIALGLCRTPVSLFQLGKFDPQFQSDPSAVKSLVMSGLCEESLSRSGRIVYSLYPSVQRQVSRIASPIRAAYAASHENVFVELVQDAVKGHALSEQGGDLDLVEEHGHDVVQAFHYLAKRNKPAKLYQALIGAWPFIYDHNHINEFLEIIDDLMARRADSIDLDSTRLLNVAGALAAKVGRSREAHSYYKFALQRLEVNDNLRVRGKVVSNLAALEWSEGNPTTALARFEFAADLFRYIGDDDSLASALIASIAAHLECGHVEEAVKALETGTSLIQSPTPFDKWCLSLGGAQVNICRGRFAEANRGAVEATRIALAIKDNLSVLRSLIWLAQSLVENDDAAQSTQVIAVAANNQTEQSYRLYPANEIRVHRIQERLQSKLGASGYRREYVVGSSRKLEQILDSICQD